MSVTRRVATQHTAINGTGPNIVVSTSGYSTNDQMVVFLASNGTLSQPGGSPFTLVTSGADFGLNWALYRRLLAGGEPGTYTFDSGASTSASVYADIFAGADTTTPLDLIFSGTAFESAQVSGSVSYVYGAFTPTRDGSMRVMYGFDNNNVNNVSTPPTNDAGTEDDVGANWTAASYQKAFGAGTGGNSQASTTLTWQNSAFGRRLQIVMQPALAGATRRKLITALMP